MRMGWVIISILIKAQNLPSESRAWGKAQHPPLGGGLRNTLDALPLICATTDATTDATSDVRV